MYNQNVILLNLYRFRFATQEQLRQMLGHRGHTQTSQILKVLLKHQVVGSFQTSSRFEAATYYLTSDGCRYLLEHEQTFGIASIPRHLYGNSEASKSLVEHSQRVLDTYLKLKGQFTDKLNYTSKVELGSKYPLKPSPDAEVVIDGQKYVLECFDEGVWKSLLRRRLWQLYSHWQLTVDSRFLLVPPNEKQRAQISKLIETIDTDFAGFCKVTTFADQ